MKEKPKKRTFRCSDLIVSSDGHLSLSKITMLFGLIISGYVVVSAVHNGTLSTEMFAVFIASTFGANSLNKAIATFGPKNYAKYGYEQTQYRQDMSTKYDDPGE